MKRGFCADLYLKIKNYLKVQCYIVYFKFHGTKVFCIGHNKTGTTTIKAVLHDFGYRLGNQVAGELLLEAWYQRDFKKIINYCKSANAFQDIPFSLPYTFQHLDLAFPKAKFILTERDSAEQWYLSLTKFHAKKWTNGERTPTAEDLMNIKYRGLGYLYKFNQYVYNTPETDIYNSEILMRFYNDYNQSVKDYFKSRPDKLIVVNVAKASDYTKLCAFLKQPVNAVNFPWKNKT
ncbi:MAG: hypothetical protein CMC55_01190 [Flavobacteriaceae bacterium]|uniref:sulfotransferase n=1 Tax=Bizionia echini TaxID=649333 RepID=UPI000C92D4CB|nr:hypothetical protein [Flavobacteriaceae bacterium]